MTASCFHESIAAQQCTAPDAPWLQNSQTGQTKGQGSMEN